MTIHDRTSARPRRGVVLIVSLGVLALLALLGVTFALFSKRARIDARNFAGRPAEPDMKAAFDFALAQLIGDTTNPLSALRGHSLLRDMYGNDARRNGLLTALPDGSPLRLLAARPDPNPAFQGFVQYRTNIPIDLVGSDFTRWTLHLAACLGYDAQGEPIGTQVPPVAQTFEVLRDDPTGSDAFSEGSYRLLTLSNPDSDTVVASSGAALAQPDPRYPFLLDGRFLNAFNGPGMTELARYPNFRLNGSLLPGAPAGRPFPDVGDPDAIGMDEDYDACDLENWFLAIQSADGSVIVPSFHRPGLLTAADWASTDPRSAAKFLRPRQVDHPQGEFPDLVPDPATGTIRFDVDNDGDGTTDAVWLDLGHPVVSDASGKPYKPLFAFTVLGLNGRIPLNTAGNLQGRTVSGSPTLSHTSHLGYSPSEINPLYALRSDVGQLRSLLAGRRVGGVPMAGRWGEPEGVGASSSRSRAGRTFFPWSRPGDVADDNFTAYDLNGESADTADLTGPRLPAEHTRRFVTPIDLAGTGLILPWDTIPSGPSDFGAGADAWGRVSFFHYSRPPGLVPDVARAPDTTSNPLHGFESFRSPSGQNASTLAAMPYNVGDGTRAPTFDREVNSSRPGSNGYPGGSLGLDEADEMNLYHPAHADAPFGPSDLEWLYRRHDLDGRALFSRLGPLASETLDSPDPAAGSFFRRRLFSIDSWESNRWVWANDNPAGAFPNNSRFSPRQNAGWPQPGTSSAEALATPSLAHRGRKINLNLPLPASNDPREPVRRKWLREAYALLKRVLPPRAVDTREELAALSQFLVNVVDFRDPDAAITLFTNPDLNLTQYGMEYCPVAINEVLAYSFRRRVPGTNTGLPTNRLFIELVNMLTEARGSRASDLDLSGWDIVVLPDTVYGRPDPLTGQTPDGAAEAPVALPATLLPALKATGTADGPGSYYVVSNPSPDPTSEQPPMGATAILAADPLASPAVATPRLGEARYYWLYLRRPANPFDAASPRVVVDAMRFPFTEAGGTGQTLNGSDRVTQGSLPLYSVQRLQPYRGGHAVPFDPTAPAASLLCAYGYSEQTAPPSGAAENRPGPSTRVAYGLYGDAAITQPIYHTLGQRNDPSDPAWDYWPFLDRDFSGLAELLLVPGCPPGLFTKRFAESAPPIAASSPQPFPPPRSAPRPPNAGSPFSADTPHTFPYLCDQFFYSGASEVPPPSAPLTPPPAPPYVGGPSGAGWFKMLEFLEVPSPAAGAVGSTAQGENFDRARRDVRPGLLNLNLIIDEEVFLGLIDDPRLNLAQVGDDQLPRVVTQVDASGAATASYPMANRGWTTRDPRTGSTGSALKAAFVDFLKLRHGGSGYLFAFGTGAVGQAPVRPGQGPIAAERPFRALSYPDIDATVLRPATLPPSSATTPPASPAPSAVPLPPPPGPSPFVGDPGVRNPYLAAANQPAQPPPIPARRLFQVPDATPASNASEEGQAQVNQTVAHPRLANPRADLASPSSFLGSGSSAGTDRRQHPAFRMEWLQKVMGLTTVRTHQYAVWITIGLFEVARPGDPGRLIPDQLGRERGSATGHRVRYRAFFVLDRTRAGGFDPGRPGRHRDVVIYRSRIE
jgi:hypothetical protein